MKIAKLAKDICFNDNGRIVRTIFKGTEVKVGEEFGDAVYVYLGIYSDPVMVLKSDLQGLS